MNVSAKYDVYLYQYKTVDTVTGDQLFPNILDIEDLRLSSSEAASQIVTAQQTDTNTSLASVVPATAPEKLKDALLDNAIFNDAQRDKDEFNWLNSQETAFFERFYTAIRAKQVEFSKSLNTVIKDPSTYINKYNLTGIFSQEGLTTINSVLGISRFSTHIESLDNSCVITLAENILNAHKITITENDVIEIVEHTENSSLPIFYGFVVSVSNSVTHGSVNSIALECFGLSKYAMISRTMKDPSIVDQYANGVEVIKTAPLPLEHNFSGKSVEDIFDMLMQQVFMCTCKPERDADAASPVDPACAVQLEKLITVLVGIAATINIASGLRARKNRSLTHVWIRNIFNMPGSSTSDALKTLAETVTAIVDEYIPKEAVIMSQLTSDFTNINTNFYNAIYDLYAQYIAVSQTKAQNSKGYISNYVANWTALQTVSSLQYSLHLLTLYFCARKLSVFGAALLIDGVPATDIVAQYQTAATDKEGSDVYQVFLNKIRSAWKLWYSQVVTPSSLLDDIKKTSFYEVFEDRPGIIRCRPPRYNLWFNEDEIDPVNITTQNKTRNDAALLTRVDYQYNMNWIGVQPFPGGHWTESDLLFKYGLRAGEPNQSPVVKSPQIANFWSAMHLTKANASTRVLTLNVVANKNYQLGKLYYIPDMGWTDAELADADKSANGVSQILSRGIVGYVSSIETNIIFGSVSVHTLKLLYVRKAEKFNITATPGVVADNNVRLNFYRLPDLETLMQHIVRQNHVDEDINFENGRSVKIYPGVQYAIEHGGYYWAVQTYKYYDLFNRYLKGSQLSPSELTDLKKHVFPTSFKVGSFGTSDGDQKGIVLQEMVNRLWLADMLHMTSTPSNSLTIDCIPDKNKISNQNMTKTWQNPLSKDNIIIYKTSEVDKVGSKISSTPKTLFYHHEDYDEYKSWSKHPSVRQAILEWGKHKVDMVPATDTPQSKDNVKHYIDGWIRPSNNDDPNTTLLTFDLERTPDSPTPHRPFYVSLFHIPYIRRFSIQNIATWGGLFALHPNSTHTSLHKLGAEVDILPVVLENWSPVEFSHALYYGYDNTYGKEYHSFTHKEKDQELASLFNFDSDDRIMFNLRQKELFFMYSGPTGYFDKVKLVLDDSATFVVNTYFTPPPGVASTKLVNSTVNGAHIRFKDSIENVKSSQGAAPLMLGGSVDFEIQYKGIKEIHENLNKDFELFMNTLLDWIVSLTDPSALPFENVVAEKQPIETISFNYKTISEREKSVAEEVGQGQSFNVPNGTDKYSIPSQSSTLTNSK